MKDRSSGENRRSLVFSLAVAAALIGVAASVPGNAKATPKSSASKSKGGGKVGWTMNLTSNFAGALQAELTDTACRMRFDKLDILMILRAPDWSAYLYNQTNHNYCVLPYEQWRKRFMFSSLRPEQANQVKKFKRVETGKKTDILGHKAVQIWVQKPDRVNPSKYVNQTEVWVARDIHPPAQFGQLLETMLKVPANAGMPLRASNLQVNGKLVSVLDTYRIQHGTIPDSDFQPLKGYRKVKDEMALMMDDSDDSMLMGDMGSSSSSSSSSSVSDKDLLGTGSKGSAAGSSPESTRLKDILKSHADKSAAKGKQSR